jgi:hypothetical protein
MSPLLPPADLVPPSRHRAGVRQADAAFDA